MMTEANLKRSAAAAMGIVLVCDGVAFAQQAAPAGQQTQTPQSAQVMNPSRGGKQVTLAFGKDYGDLRRRATISNINCPVVVSPVQLPGTMIGVRVGEERVVATDEAYAAHIANEMCVRGGK